MIGTKFSAGRDNGVDNRLLNAINEEIRSHPVEVTGEIGGDMRRCGVIRSHPVAVVGKEPRV